jgi:vWA-MoxR associated protein C-terminal domain/vWA-MoxR associated protein middle region 0/Effector-associated domain 2
LKPSRLSVRDLHRLSDAFLQVPGMQYQDKRNQYLTLLESELDTSLPVERGRDAAHDVFAIVQTCLGYSDGIWALLEILEGFHDHSYPMIYLRHVVRELFPVPLLEKAERNDLRRLLSGVRITGVAQICDAVAPFGPLLEADPDNLAEVVDDLEDMSCPLGGVPPVLAFVEHLIVRIGSQSTHNPIETSLRMWARHVAERLRISQEAIRRVRAEAATLGRQTMYVITDLRPHDLDDDLYLMSVWLQRWREEPVPLHRDDQPRRLPEVPAKLDELLRRRPALGEQVNELTLEFVLPRRILCCPVDEWEIGGELPYQLGIVYPVVVRDRDRIGETTSHPDWRRKWAWIVANGHLPDAAAVHWEPDVGGQALLARLLRDERRVCLVLPSPPFPHRRPAFAMLGYGLRAGVPAIVWSRNNWDIADLVDRLRNHPLAELPQLALRLRQEANEQHPDMDHVGRHLSLLFDSADRLPPAELPLTEPTPL